jgi:hypothetical protein
MVNIMDNENVTHNNRHIWEKICVFFGHDAQVYGPEYCVVIYGFHRFLLPVQAHGVWYSLRLIHGLEGGVILGHGMGIGKTTMAFAIHWVQHCINRMWDDIEKNPHKHYSPELAVTDPEHTKCPSASSMKKEFGFDCPCHPDSPTHFVKQRYGISIGLVPLALVDTWKAEHKMCFPDNTDQDITVAHGMGRVTEEQWELLKGDEQELEYSDTEPDEPKYPAPSVWHPRLENGKCFVLSTEDSFLKYFTDSTHNQTSTVFTRSFTPKTEDGIPQPRQQKSGTYDAISSCIVSLLFKDEFHNRKGPTIRCIECLVAEQPDYRIACVFMSGTPITTGPKDLVGFVELMRWKGWKKHTVLKNWRGTGLRDLATSWERLMAKQKKTIDDEEEVAKIIKKMSPLVEALMVRFTVESNFLGRTVVKAPKSVFKIWQCKHEDKWAKKANDISIDEIRQYEKKEAKRRREYEKKGLRAEYKPLNKHNLNSYYRSRVIASFPFLADLKDENGDYLKLTAAEWQAHQEGKNGAKKWISGTDSDPYSKNLDQICASSGKITRYKKILQAFSPRKFGLDAEGKPTRHVICSYFFVVVHILKLVRHVLKSSLETVF